MSLEPITRLEAILAGEDIEPKTRKEYFVKEAVDNGGGGGGGELPEVTSADNGDVLTVVEGAWAKAAPSGGSSKQVFDYTVIYDGTRYALDGGPDAPNYSDVKSAMDSGADCYARITINDVVVAELPFNYQSEIQSEDKQVSANGLCRFLGIKALSLNLYDDDAMSFLVDGIPTNLKPTYEFGFTVTSDGQGGYTATADSGSTYAAITAALAETPNVYGRVNFNSEEFTGLFSHSGANFVNAAMVIYGDFAQGGTPLFYALRLRVESDDSCGIVIAPLTAAN